MKRKTIYLALLLTFCWSRSLVAQDWLKEHFKGGIGHPDKLTEILRAEMQEAIGFQVPPIPYIMIDGGRDSLANRAGDVLLVLFWKPTCSGSRSQMPVMSQLQQEYAAKNLRVVYLSSVGREQQVAYFEANPMDGIKGVVRLNQLERPYQLFATPSAFVVDRDGFVREAWIGPADRVALEKRIRPYLD